MKAPTAIDRCRQQIESLAIEGLRRQLEPRNGIDFTSNDFLALSGDNAVLEAVRSAIEDGVPVGAGASRLLRGNFEEHQQLETQASEFFGAEKALNFASGYIANHALLTTLPVRGDLIAFDALAHASARHAIHASHAKGVKFAHNDADSLEDILRRWRTRNPSATPWIYVESLYSMDGDSAPLEELFDVADRFDAMLIVDEAHATGVWGECGRGFTAAHKRRANLVALHTCGKALGVSGGLVCASREIIDLLIAKAAPFIYSTAPSPLLAVAVSTALKLLKDSNRQRKKLHCLISAANALADSLPNTQGSGSQIIPIVLGDNDTALRVSGALRDNGFDVRAIRPPTVPAGTARLRLSITLHVEQSDIEQMFQCLQSILEREEP